MLVHYGVDVRERVASWRVETPRGDLLSLFAIQRLRIKRAIVRIEA